VTDHNWTTVGTYQKDAHRTRLVGEAVPKKKEGWGGTGSNDLWTETKNCRTRLALHGGEGTEVRSGRLRGRWVEGAVVSPHLSRNLAELRKPQTRSPGLQNRVTPGKERGCENYTTRTPPNPLKRKGLKKTPFLRRKDKEHSKEALVTEVNQIDPEKAPTAIGGSAEGSRRENRAKGGREDRGENRRGTPVPFCRL